MNEALNPCRTQHPRAESRRLGRNGEQPGNARLYIFQTIGCKRFKGARRFPHSCKIRVGFQFFGKLFQRRFACQQCLLH